MKDHRIIFFTKYTRAGASSRYRTYQYLPCLQSAGFDLGIMPLLGDRYLISKFTAGGSTVRDVLIALGQRIIAVLTLPRRCTLVIEYELLPFFPAWLERWLCWWGCRWVLDYDDALFHQYDQHRNPWVRRLLGDKIATVMRLADAVVVGNDYLANYAKRAGAKHVMVIPTVVDLLRYPLQSVPSRTDTFTIGWIGSPTTACYLLSIATALVELGRHGRVRVQLIGSGPVELPGVPVEVLPWSEEDEVEMMRGFDVGIMPLPDEPWARGKCGFKLIQYMALGLPVVASPVGVNAEIVEEGVNGYLASTREEWCVALKRLMDSPADRQRMGQAGRRKVEAHYSLQVTAPKWVDVIREVANGSA